MSLTGITDLNKPQATELFEAAATEFLKWNLLEAGGFLNVTIPSSGVGNSLHLLHEVILPGQITARTTYQTSRSDWVWESGVARSSQPIKASGVYVNGSFAAFSTTVVPDYPNGRVTFSTPLASGSTVAANYSCRTARIYNPRTAPWWREVQQNSFAGTQTQISQAGSGVFDTLAQNRIQLPAIMVQAVPRTRRFEAYQVGSLQRLHNQDVVFNIIADNPTDRDRLHDILVNQWEASFAGLDLDAVATANRYPIVNGEVAPSALCYPALAAAFPWKNVRVANVSSDWQEGEADRPQLHCATVRWQVEAILP